MKIGMQRTRPNARNGEPLQAWVRALEKTASTTRTGHRILPSLIDDLADQYGEAPALLSERHGLTYRSLAALANQYARWALAQDIGPGNDACILMHNCPDYMAIWLGISRVGGTAALINTNLSGAPLAHAINMVGPRHVIVGAKLLAPLANVLPRLAAPVRLWMHGAGNHDFPRIDEEIALYSDDRLDRLEYRPPSMRDRALYIYTSGTTGLPKAASVSHFRLMQWSHWFAGMMDTRPSDRMYNCLPMYHSIGGVVATGALLVNGGSVVIRERFSASQFWNDVVVLDCTLFQYIGELCRYLANSEPHRLETQHKIRLCCGSGLKAGVWEQFKRRFQIPQIIEFYAATEGNFSLYNCDGVPGAIGRIPRFLEHRFHMVLVKFDMDTGEPVRNAEGYCIRCAPNEIGEAIGEINHENSGSGSRFEGYADTEASEKKVLRNAFARGDAWFRSGDLMRKDDRGYFYFVDRFGDTFRWKGENVSTTEVAEAILAFPAVTGAVVYGVIVPGTEGRAGMVAVAVRADFDLAAFRKYLADHLPSYACPLFLRIVSKFEVTATFKPIKQELRRQGYDPEVSDDAVYFNDRIKEEFVRIDATVYDRLLTCKLRL